MHMDKKFSAGLLSRRQVIGAGVGLVAMAGLAACGATDGSAGKSDTGAAATTASDESVQIDAVAYDALIAAGNIAPDATIASNTWAKKIKDAGKIRIGGVQTSTLFSLLNEKDNKLRGFDAGLAQLLTRYILGDENKYDFRQVTSDTRESVVTNDQVDLVIATYSITDKRKTIVSFAGPYYTSQQAILVKADNTTINSVDDLNGKNVAAQSGSTGPQVLEKLAPKANVQQFSTDEEARTALGQGRVDAYVIDVNLQLGSMVKNPGKFRLAGEQFGDIDPYGIALPLNSDGVTFVNDWLSKIERDGTWAKLWKVAIGDRTGVETVPEPPALGV